MALFLFPKTRRQHRVFEERSLTIHRIGRYSLSFLNGPTGKGCYLFIGNDSRPFTDTYVQYIKIYDVYYTYAIGDDDDAASKTPINCNQD